MSVLMCYSLVLQCYFASADVIAILSVIFPWSQFSRGLSAHGFGWNTKFILKKTHIYIYIYIYISSLQGSLYFHVLCLTFKKQSMITPEAEFKTTKSRVINWGSKCKAPCIFIVKSTYSPFISIPTAWNRWNRQKN